MTSAQTKDGKISFFNFEFDVIVLFAARQELSPIRVNREVVTCVRLPSTEAMQGLQEKFEWKRVMLKKIQKYKPRQACFSSSLRETNLEV